MPARLVLTNVEKTFESRKGTVNALHDINLTLADGEFLSVVGASGCGKSTLLRIVAGLEPPTSGTLTLDNAPLQGPGRDRGMVFQQYTLYPWLSALTNVEFGLRHLPKKQREDVARRFLDVVGLTDFAGSYPSQLSGGMQQRVAIARALALGPSILLMDEPFGALDAQTRSLMQELLLSIWERDRLSVLFVTHDIDEAIFLADRICVMATKPGRIREMIDVPLPRPRDFSQQVGNEFLELKQYVRGLIHDEAARNTGFASVLR
ncbi:MAG TPA: ABC transporter ATP-binding protein [Acidimicrobiales bacterium]|nr:ABC transporter ATP-binding protein [Acidimicrobiales bacterium]